MEKLLAKGFRRFLLKIPLHGLNNMMSEIIIIWSTSSPAYDIITPDSPKEFSQRTYCIRCEIGFSILKTCKKPLPKVHMAVIFKIPEQAQRSCCEFTSVSLSPSLALICSRIALPIHNHFPMDFVSNLRRASQAK